MNPQQLYTTKITSLESDIPRLLDAAGLADIIPKGQPILIKPNLVEALEPPITTPVHLVSLLISYLQKRFPGQEIIIGEGTGSLEYDTHHPFKMLGYNKLATEENIQLIDLNFEKLTKKENLECTRWPVMHLPSILDEVFLLSVPVLKVHTLAKVTLTMKNMMGCVPPSHFRGKGHYGQSAFHQQIHEAIFDLNRYRSPDFTLLDASIGMAESHLWGKHCNPPLNTLAASTDIVAIDAFGAKLLGKRWQDIGYIYMADSVLGSAETTAITI
ncbi:MAG: DUF362 domain-containing protein [Desulfocapsa sp.]|nr:DUF362 domain-containing protein [Desulfocapsa sp.]